MQSISLLIFILMISFNVFGKLEEIKTKQAINNIRYISPSGKHTYFKNQKGELRVSFNYDVFTVLKGEAYDDFIITANKETDDLLIQIIKTPDRTNWYFSENEIYLTKLGGKKAEKIAKGQVPKLHQKGQYLTVYNPLKKEIHVSQLKNQKKDFTINIANHTNPYFIPNIFMITPNDIIYTDINSKGIAAVLMYSLLDKRFETVYKAQEKSKKLEICIKDGAAFIGEFPYQMLGRNSSITKVDLFNNFNFQNAKVIYSNKYADLGNMICQDERIFFIKTSEYKTLVNFKKTNVAVLNIKSESVKTISELDDVTQIFEMSNMILAPYKGKVLVVKGKNQVIDDAIKKVKP